MVNILGPKKVLPKPTGGFGQSIAVPNGRNPKVDLEAPVQLYDPHYDPKKVHVGLRRNQTPMAEDDPKEWM